MTYKPNNSLGEDVIIVLLREGNENAIKIIFDKYHASVFFFATQLVKDSFIAEDIVAESFIKLWQRKTDFRHLPAVKSFLYVTVKNACLNHLKQFNRHSACHEEIKYLSDTSEDLYADQKLLKAEMLQEIWKDIEELPPVRRKIFKMIYMDGLNTFEIARELRISVDTVRVQKARALHTIRATKKQKND